MNNTIFIVDGLQGSGKKSFISKVREKLLNVYIISYHNNLETIARKMGWRNKPDDLENYIFLRKIHHLWVSFNNELYNSVIKDIEELNSPHITIFILPKTGKDIDKLVEGLKEHNVKTVLIYNKKVAEVYKDINHINNYNYDIIINNNGSLSDLKKEADIFIGRYVKHFLRMKPSALIPKRPVKSTKRKTKKLKNGKNN